VPSSIERMKVLIAGVLSLVVTVGVARFAYTPLLPVMQQSTWLNESGGGWLATFNYAGYLCGALLVMLVRDERVKFRLYQLYLLLAIVTTAAMGWTDSLEWWGVLRFLSGLSSSGGLLLATGMVLSWLLRNKLRGELGIHFTGIGLGIVLVSLMVEGLLALAVSWQWQWSWLALAATVLVVPAWVWMPRPAADSSTTHGRGLHDNPPGRSFLWVMLIAYFCAGYGYVISATFIVDIVEGQPGLQGQGQWVFLLIGIAALPAVLVWDYVARRVGYLQALMLAYGIQVIGIMMPALTNSLAGAVVGGVLYGGTFVGCVSLVLTLAGLFYPSSPARLMGKMTLAYGAAQIVAPALTGVLAQGEGNYDTGLYLAAGVIALGTGLIGVLMLLARQDKVGHLVLSSN